MHGGVGFVVRLTNTGDRNVEFDPTKIRAELLSGRRVSLLTSREIAAQFLQTEASMLDTDRRQLEQRDIESDPRFAAGPVRPWVPTMKFLALGSSRVTGGELASYLSMTLLCDRMGRMTFAGTDSN